MKKTILLIIIITSYHYGLSQCVDCPKDKDISTNPEDPKNCDVDAWINTDPLLLGKTN